jgi:hypothetical protein
MMNRAVRTLAPCGVRIGPIINDVVDSSLLLRRVRVVKCLIARWGLKVSQLPIRRQFMENGLSTVSGPVPEFQMQ